MPKYIKSHSNYVLKNKHQLVKDGTIYERDITTIGAVNQFAPGQIPIYRSGNFIITVRDDRRGVNQYNTKNWEKGADGEVWTLSTVENMTSNDSSQDDTKIVLKNDYYDFREFAYYGSLTELFRASINDALARFPGELYLTPGENDDDGTNIAGAVYYTKPLSVDLENQDRRVRLGGDDYFEVSNPFGINIHTELLPPGADPVKYFAEDGYRQYLLIINNTVSPITSWTVTQFDPCLLNECDITPSSTRKVGRNGGNRTFTQTTGTISQEKFRKAAEITLNGSYTLYAYLGDNGIIHYLYKKSDNIEGIHIRPNDLIRSEFYNGCNDLQRIMFAQDTDPLYKAIFSVIDANDYGYTRQLEEFIYPTSDGGYNLAVGSEYLERLVKIGEFYDEYFTDNLYRSMTHESIKNFDWTYTREYNEGDEVEYVHGGEKIQKALRVFAREFDEVKKYIDNIKYTGRLTYDGRANIPDYFLSDLCEEDGWDLKSVMPYELDGITTWTYEALMNNSGGTHEYSQNSKTTVKPYSSNNIQDGTENGYFLDCSGSPAGISGCLEDWYGTKDGDDCYMRIRKANEGEFQTIFERCGDGSTRIEYRIKSYTDDTKEYTYMDLNYEFLRRLKLNSRSLWRHKGTLEGIEMILGMFGLKSKRWLERNGKCKYGKYEANDCSEYDYEIIEYTQFTNKIDDNWDDVHQMYEIDWLNSTKTITYDYRFVSNYTKPGSIGVTYIPYQGLPVSYRDPYDSTEGTGVRYLYPNFNKDEQLDGNPYFQMDGGWLAKTVGGKKTGTETDNYYNFQFDVDDNIVKNGVIEPTVVDGFIIDNHKLYKETVRSIRRVEDLTELLLLPQQDLYDGIICFVGRVNDSVAVINGEVFDIENDEDREFVTFTRRNGFIKVGDLYFDESIVVYDYDGTDYVETVYSIDDKFDGYEIRAYINDDTFICYSSENPNYAITNFNIIRETDSIEYSNYYILDDTVFSDSIAFSYNSNGWKRLKKTDPDFLKINTIENYYEGNNGHNGNLRYDSGHEYFTYFQRLFKYAEDNSLFDTRCFSEGFDDVYDNVHNIGFQGLIDPNEGVKDYDKYLSADTKVHYFGNYKTRKNDNTIDNIYIYGDRRKYEPGAWNSFYGKDVSYYSIGGGTSITGEIQPHTSTDDVTNQIVNNKRIKIVFNMKRDFNTPDGQIELKYMDNIVMNYLTQMLPSTVITEIEYKYCNFDYDGC